MGTRLTEWARAGTAKSYLTGPGVATSVAVDLRRGKPLSGSNMNRGQLTREKPTAPDQASVVEQPALVPGRRPSGPHRWAFQVDKLGRRAASAGGRFPPHTRPVSDTGPQLVSGCLPVERPPLGLCAPTLASPITMPSRRPVRDPPSIATLRSGGSRLSHAWSSARKAPRWPTRTNRRSRWSMSPGRSAGNIEGRLSSRPGRSWEAVRPSLAISLPPAPMGPGS
jgi:hypothetical protein